MQSKNIEALGQKPVLLIISSLSDRQRNRKKNAGNKAVSSNQNQAKQLQPQPRLQGQRFLHSKRSETVVISNWILDDVELDITFLYDGITVQCLNGAPGVACIHLDFLEILINAVWELALKTQCLQLQGETKISATHIWSVTSRLVGIVLILCAVMDLQSEDFGLPLTSLVFHDAPCVQV